MSEVKESEDTKDSDFFIEVSVRISVTSDKFPDDEATAIMDKIKTKIFCNRENMTLVGSKVDIYEVVSEDEED